MPQIPPFNPIPTTGPSLYTVPGFRTRTIAVGGSVGPTGSNALTIIEGCAFQFPRDVFVTGLLVVPHSGALVDLGRLTLRVQDETQEDMIGTSITGVAADLSIATLLLHGTASRALSVSALPYMRPFPLQRPVRATDRWLFTIGNPSAVEVTVAAVLIYFQEARASRYHASANA